MPRSHGRADDQIRTLKLTRAFTDASPGSVLIEAGRTRVLCTASVDERVPEWMSGRGNGWVTGEYAMLPGSTSPRKRRESAGGKRDGRGVEISRLVGRALRAVVDMRELGERTIWLDCDVLVADGGTRTAAISGAYVALMDACRWLFRKGKLEKIPITQDLAAVSVGIVDGRPLLDLDYKEDSRAEVDMNVVMTGDGRFVEVQGAAERGTFSREQHDALLGLAGKGIGAILRAQKLALETDPEGDAA